MSQPRNRNHATRKTTHRSRWPLRLAVLIFVIGAVLAGQVYWQDNLAVFNENLSVMYGDKFTIKQINVSGNNQLAGEEVIGVSHLQLGQNLLSLDVNMVREALEQNGWVESAAVSRVYPYTVNITIEEAIPQALWWNNDGFYLIARSGRIIKQIPDPLGKPPYMLIFGAEAPSKYSKMYQELFNHAIFPQVVAMSNIRGRRWDIYLEDGTLIKLPEINVGKALNLLDKLHKNGIMKSRGVRELDMRLSPEKIFVKNK